jgi:hypothetical protein
VGGREGASKHVIAQIRGTTISWPPCWNFLSTRTRTCTSTTCARENAIERIHDESGRDNGGRFIELYVFIPSALAGSNHDVSVCDRQASARCVSLPGYLPLCSSTPPWLCSRCLPFVVVETSQIRPRHINQTKVKYSTTKSEDSDHFNRPPMLISGVCMMRPRALGPRTGVSPITPAKHGAGSMSWNRAAEK